MIRSCAALAIACVLSVACRASDNDWNLFGRQVTYAGGMEGPTAGFDLADQECMRWNMFCPLGFTAAPEDAADWNFLQAAGCECARPVEQQVAADTRQVVYCLVPDTFFCPGCDWWKAWAKTPAAAEAPYRLEFVVDNGVGDQPGRPGEKKGWPVFRLTSTTGTAWDVWDVGDPQSLAQQFNALRSR